MAQYFMLCPCYHYMHLKSDNRCTAVKKQRKWKEGSLCSQDIDSFTWLGVRAHRCLCFKSMHGEKTYNWVEKVESVVLSFTGRCWALLAFSNISRNGVCLMAHRHWALQRQGNFPSFPKFSSASFMVSHTPRPLSEGQLNVMMFACPSRLLLNVMKPFLTSRSWADVSQHLQCLMVPE